MQISYTIPIADAHCRKKAEPILLYACIHDLHLPEGTEEFPEGTEIKMTKPQLLKKGSRHEIAQHPTWTITMPDDDTQTEPEPEKLPTRREYERFIAETLAVLDIQHEYFHAKRSQDPQAQSILVKSKEMEKQLRARAIQLQRSAPKRS